MMRGLSAGRQPRSRTRRLRILQKFEQWTRPWHGRGVQIFSATNKQGEKFYAQILLQRSAEPEQGRAVS
jgi:hypothetical protein